MFVHLLRGLVAVVLLTQAATASETPTGGGPETYLVGITPWQKGLAADDINRLYLPMLKHLADATGQNYRVERMESYEDTVAKIANGEIQIAMLSPAPYVKARKLNPKLEFLVTEQSWNADKSAKVDSYRSLIIVRKDRNDLRSLDALRGKSLGLVSESSTSGYTVPMAYFRQKKIDPKSYFSKVLLLGSHPAVTDGVVAGMIDAGATWDFNLGQASAKHGYVFKTIWTSDAIPNLCVVAHPKVPAALRSKLRELFLKIEPEVLKGLPAAGYVQRDDSFYDSIRKIEGQ